MSINDVIKLKNSFLKNGRFEYLIKTSKIVIYVPEINFKALLTVHVSVDGK